MKRIILLLLLLISIQGFSQTQDNRTPVGTITPFIPMPGFNLDSVRLLGSMWTGASWTTRTFYGADIIRYDLKKSDTGWVATQLWVQNSFPTIQRFLDSLAAVRSAVGTGGNSNASSVPWSGITGTPTTLQGYNLLGDAYTKGQIDATFAPLYSPALAGTPTGPTATAGSSNNQLATTAFVQNAVAASSTGVSSFNGRTGAVSPLSGDYSSFYPILSGSYANPSWITSLAWSKIAGTPALDSTGIGGYHTLNFYDARYLAPINTNTASIATNTTNIASYTTNITNLLSYYNGSVIKPTSLPIGSPSALGAYKVGSGLSVAGDGTLSATGAGGVAASNAPQNYLTGFNTWGLLAGDSIKVKSGSYAAAAGTVAGTDNLALAIQKLDGNIQANTTAIAAKQGTLTLTTTGTSGAATLTGSTLNIPQYSGGGGTSFPTQQVDATTGTSVTITNQSGNIWLVKNPATSVASYAITFPATPVDGQRMWISFGGTISTGGVVTSLSFSGNGKTIIQGPTTPTSVAAGETIEYQYTASNTTWYRIK